MNTAGKTCCIHRVLALLLSLFLLTSCSQSVDQLSDNGSEASTTEAAETEINKAPDGLDDVNMDGFELRILAGLTAWTNAKYISEQDGEPVNDAIYKRNRYLEERFTCKISAFQDESLVHYEVANKAKTDVTSGDRQYNMFSIYDVYIVELLPYISSWNNVPYIKMNEVWWNPDATEVYNWGGKQVALNGYTGISSVACATNIIFNKDMFTALNFDQSELYSIVKDGSWTLDVMYEYGKAAVQDINGDSVLNDKDQWGFHDASSVKSFVNGAIASANIRYIEYDENHNPTFSFDEEKRINILQTFIDKTMSSGVYYSNVQNPDQSTQPYFFIENRALFAQANLFGIEGARSIESFEFGILPFPKFDDTIENYRSLSVGSAATFLPRTVLPDECENIGILVEAMAFNTYHEVLPIYKEIALKTKSARDNESADMLDIIFNTICFDMGHSLESLITKPLITATFIKKDSGAVASAVEKNKNSIQAKLDEMLGLISEIN